jgi:predicted nucleic acid-binding Zn ribbon protein
MKPMPIGDIIGAKSQQSALWRGVSAALTVETANAVLNELFGAKVGSRATAEQFKNRTLAIACTSSIVTQEIKLHEKRLLETINRRLGRTVVDRIRFTAESCQNSLSSLQ